MQEVEAHKLALQCSFDRLGIQTAFSLTSFGRRPSYDDSQQAWSALCGCMAAEATTEVSD